MASCPVCHQGIEIKDQHLGALFTCPSCDGVFFVGWDGQPELAAPEIAGPDGAEVAPEFAPVESPISFEAPPPGDAVVFGMPGQPESFPDFGSPLGALEPTPAETPSANPAPEIFADVTAFANSNQTEGALSYSLQIRGIEIAETRENLLEALTDSRFGWDPKEIMARVTNGVLNLSGLNPTKASILVSRIKFLPIELEWTQEVFSGS